MGAKWKQGAGLLAMCMALMTAAVAQAELPNRSVGLDGAINVPVGDQADSAGAQVAGFLRYEQKVAPQWAVTARAGLSVWGLQRDMGSTGTASLTWWSLHGGAVFRPQGMSEGLFATAEVGVNTSTVHAFLGKTDPIEAIAPSQTTWGMIVGGGYRAKALSFRLAINDMDLQRPGAMLGILLGAGWDFYSF